MTTVPLSVPFAGVAAWLVTVDPDEACLAWLGAEERARAARLSPPAAARRWIAGRCAIRRVVAAHLGGEPASLRLASDGGRPSLPDHPGAHVSLARREGHLAIALADRRVGVDVEVAAPDARDALVARHLFHPDDPPVACRDDFYRLWTRKEAAFKLTGGGKRFDPADRVADRLPDGRRIVSASIATPVDTLFCALAVVEAR